MTIKAPRKGRLKFFAVAIIAIIIVSSVAVYALSQGASQQTTEATTIRLSEFSTGNLPVDWAIEKGLFREANLNVVTWTTDSGSAATQAIVAGSSDMHSGDFSLLSSSVANGADLKGFLYNSANGFVVATTNTSSIQTVTDLKGKTVGVSSYGSGSDLSLRALVSKYGLDPDKDLSIIQIGNSGLIAALVAKTIDAGVTSQTSIDQQGDLKTIAIVRDEIPGFGGGTFYVSSTFLAENGDALKSFAKVILKAQQQIIANPNEAAQFYSNRASVALKDATIFVNDSIETWDASSTFGHFDGREEGLNSTISWMLQLDVISETIPLSDIIAYGYAP